MDNTVFNDQEDQISEQVKSAIYYSSPVSVDEIRGLLSSIEKERATEILETTLMQIGFEQKQRRDYVLSSAGIDPTILTAEDGRIIVKVVALYDGNTVRIQEFILQSGIENKTLRFEKISNETLEQAKVFKRVDDNLVMIFSKTLYSKRMKPLLTAIDKLPADRLQSVIEQTKDYIHRVEQLGDDIIIKNPDFSNAMKQLFELTGLSIVSNKQETIGQKMGFCGDVLLSAAALNYSRTQGVPLSEESMERLTGGWLLKTEGTPAAEDILNY